MEPIKVEGARVGDIEELARKYALQGYRLAHITPSYMNPASGSVYKYLLLFEPAGPAQSCPFVKSGKGV